MVPGGIVEPEEAYKNQAMTNNNQDSNIFYHDLKDRIEAIPFEAQYSCVFWTNTYVDCAQVFQDRYIDSFSDKFFTYEYIIDNVPLKFDAYFDFTNLELNPEYSDQEFLRQGNLFSVTADFKVLANVFVGNGVQLADGAVLQMFYNNQEADGTQILGPHNKEFPAVPS